MEDVQKTDAIETDKLEEVTGGDELRGDRVPKYRCQKCGQKYALPKGPNGMNCLVCGGKLEFIGVE